MKVLIFSASTGGGHMTAAKALKKSILGYDKNSEIKIIDTLKYINFLLDKTISEGYEHMAKKTPKIFGALYHSSNKENKLKSLVIIFNQLLSRKLVPLIKKEKPDIIISTHPFATEMLSKLKKSHNINAPLVCVMTDYAPHKTWITNNVNAYIVANEEMKALMSEMGVEKDIIFPFGIPVDDSFYIRYNKEKILSEMGLDPNKPTILIMAGSFGVNGILKIYKNILEINTQVQIIVITGKNEKLYREFKKILSGKKKISLERIKQTGKIFAKTKSFKVIRKFLKSSCVNKETRLIFFTNEVSKYMQIADLIITKPGGLTVSEALACDLPMAIFAAIPGQEEENAEFLIKNNMAVKIENVKRAKEVIEQLILDRSKLKSMRKSCTLFDKSKSNENIFNLLSNLLEK